MSILPCSCSLPPATALCMLCVMAARDFVDHHSIVRTAGEIRILFYSSSRGRPLSLPSTEQSTGFSSLEMWVRS
jgi:hypothetical protein